jgi:Ca2+-binding RTX toxin-like protein
MAKININSDRNTQFDVTTSNNVVTLVKGVTVNSQTNGIYEAANLSGNRIVIEGNAFGSGFSKGGVMSEGSDVVIEIAEGGLAGGNFGIVTTGDNARAVNNGRIQTGNVAVSMIGEDSSFINHGTIVSKFSYGYYGGQVNEFSFENDGRITSINGLKFDAVDLTAMFGKDSVVKAENEVIMTYTNLGEIARISNQGELKSTGSGFLDAIGGGAGQEIIRNSGIITGSVNMSGGDDRFDGRGGQVLEGVVLGEAGNDIYVISDKNTRAFETIGEGYDKLTVLYSYKLDDNDSMEEVRLAGKADLKLSGNNLDNYLQGNSGDNRLIGNAGQDAFFGGAGNDVLTGGADADGFYFRPNADREVITDFTDGEDLLILFTGDEIKSLTDLIAHHAHQQGDDLVISGDGTEMIIRDFDKANLTVADFTS